MKYIGHLKYDDVILQSKSIIICGGGDKLVDLIDGLKEKNVLNRVLAIADRDKKKQGSFHKNIPIYSYEYILKNYPKASYIVYNQYSKEICDYLFDEGVRDMHLYREI